MSSDTAHGTLHRIVTEQWMSSALRSEKRLSVLLPVSRPQRNRGYPVLVLLHGYGGSRQTWIDRTRLLECLCRKDLVVVLPESGRRWFINDHAGLRYEDYLIGEVIPFVKSSFDVFPGRRGWAIGGFSMGGASALLQAMRYPGMFSAVVSHAGAFEAPFRRGDPYSAVRGDPRCAIPPTAVHERVWGPYGSVTRSSYDPYSLIRSWRSEMSLHVYSDVGTCDYERIVQMNRNVVLALRAAGIGVEYHERAGAHDLEFLSSALPYSLDFACRMLACTAE